MKPRRLMRKLKSSRGKHKKWHEVTGVRGVLGWMDIRSEPTRDHWAELSSYVYSSYGEEEGDQKKKKVIKMTGIVRVTQRSGPYSS